MVGELGSRQPQQPVSEEDRQSNIDVGIMLGNKLKAQILKSYIGFNPKGITIKSTKAPYRYTGEGAESPLDIWETTYTDLDGVQTQARLVELRHNGRKPEFMTFQFKTPDRLILWDNKGQKHVAIKS